DTDRFTSRCHEASAIACVLQHSDGEGVRLTNFICGIWRDRDLAIDVGLGGWTATAGTGADCGRGRIGVAGKREAADDDSTCGIGYDLAGRSRIRRHQELAAGVGRSRER